MNNRESAPLDICLLTYRGNPFSGGQGVYVRYLSRELIRRGHRVDVIAGRPYPHLPEGANLIKLPGLNLLDNGRAPTFADLVKRFATRPEPRRWLTDLLEIAGAATGGFPEPFTFGRRVVNYLGNRSDRYDIIHDNQSLAYGLLELKERGFPVVATIHHPITIDRDIALDRTRMPHRRWMTKRWYRFLEMQKQVARQLDRIITVSDQAKRDIQRDFEVEADRIRTVYNGIDTSTFRPVSGVSRRPDFLLTTSNVMPMKGLSVLLKAFAALVPEYPHLQLGVIGERDEMGMTSQLMQRLNISEQVTFHAQISTERMVELYSRATLAVVPSLYEGFGLPAGEAMACGAPVVATETGGLPEVVGDHGVLVEPNDPNALAKGIARLLEDPEKRSELSRRGRDRITSTFSWSRAAGEVLETYRNALGEPRPAS